MPPAPLSPSSPPPLASSRARSGGEVEGLGSAAGGAGRDARCPMDPYDIEADKCKYVDQQTLKLQEAPEMVPTGEMPRHLLLVVERNLADRVSPGTRASAIGIVSTVATGGGRGRGGDGGGGGGGASGRGLAVKSLYLRVLGIMVQGEGSGRTQSSFTHDEEEEMRRLSREPRFYDRLAASVAPSISGDYTTDIKKAILCLLVAGSRKVLPDGVRLRGDINVLMLGDPSTAKSQFLKVRVCVLWEEGGKGAGVRVRACMRAHHPLPPTTSRRAVCGEGGAGGRLHVGQGLVGGRIDGLGHQGRQGRVLPRGRRHGAGRRRRRLHRRV